MSSQEYFLSVCRNFRGSRFFWFSLAAVITLFVLSTGLKLHVLNSFYLREFDRNLLTMCADERFQAVLIGDLIGTFRMDVVFFGLSCFILVIVAPWCLSRYADRREQKNP